MVEAAGGATWAPVAAALTTTAVWAGALATTATAAAVDSGSISAVTVTVAPTAKKPTAARAAPTLKAAHSRKLAVQESGAFSDPDSFLCPYSPECVEGVFSEVGLPLYGVLGSCTSACYPSYLTTLRNTTAGLITPPSITGGDQLW